MKFKIPSILKPIILLSVALSLTAFLGCGGGGSSAGGAGTTAYDGTWSLNLKGYTLPPPAVVGGTAPTCTEDWTPITIANGNGSTLEYLTCQNAAPGTYYVAINVSFGLDATGTGTVQANTTGGSHIAGTCINRVSCQATNFLMTKCGQAGAGC